MAESMFSLSEIKELMDKLAQANLGEVTLKAEGFELSIRAKEPAAVAAPLISPLPAPAPAVSIPAPGASVPAVPPAAAEAVLEQPRGNVVKSPIVGTFYAAPAPDKPPFVTVGSQVKKGDVLFVIESMKLMNEITSEYDGEVVEILVDNAQGVEYNQPILVIR